MTVRISPTLTAMATYPFVRLEEARRRLLADGVEVIDFGKGDPNEPTDPMIRQALVDALPERAPYPLAQGLPELREAAARWVGRRFGVEVDADTEVVPTYGSKEAIFSLAQVLDTAGRTVVYCEPAYPVYERGAAVAGARVRTLPLRRERSFLPDLSELDDDVALVWVNYPHNPTGAVAPREFYDELAEAAARHDFVVASDEAYSELWFSEPPGSALQGTSTRGAEDVVSERTGLQRGAAAQRPEKGPASLRCVQALRVGVHGGPPAGEPPPRIRDEGPVPGDDTQQVGDRSARPAAHTGAHRDRRFGHSRL